MQKTNKQILRIKCDADKQERQEILHYLSVAHSSSLQNELLEYVDNYWIYFLNFLYAYFYLIEYVELSKCDQNFLFHLLLCGFKGTSIKRKHLKRR